MTSPAIAPDLTEGDLRLSLDQRRIWRDGREIHLTAMEWRLLVWFMENPGKAVSREGLFEEVWGETEFFGGLKTIDVHICRLRAKVGPGHIATLHHFGYRWERAG